MRELQVIGLDAAGKNVTLHEKGSDERFSVPADDRLRAAARGDLSRLGQIEVEMNSELRPREIQAKVRAGASVAEVASLAGIPESRVERFAHPVLLERGNAAEIGRKGHPIRSDGPAEQTLDEIVTAVFRSRGLDPESGEWDAWRNVAGEWIVQLAWQAGRSDNAAHWRLYKEGLGGTLTALDDAAHDLIDPDFNRPRRPLAPVSSLGSEGRVGVHGPETDTPADDGADEPAHAGTPTSDPHRVGSADVGVAPDGTEDVQQNSPAAEPANAPEGARAPADASGNEDATGDERAGSSAPPAAETTGSTADETPPTPHDPVAADEEEPQDALIPHPEPGRKPAKGRKNKPTMPSWEDVLLGVRSNNG